MFRSLQQGSCSLIVWMFAFVVALSLSFSAQVVAQSPESTLIYGPEEFIRSIGQSNDTVIDVPLPPGVTGPFELEINNGRSGLLQLRTTSARIYINDIQVVGPNDFGMFVSRIHRTVDLGPSNTLRVRHSGGPGRRFTLQINGHSVLAQPVAASPAPLRVAPGATAQLKVELSPVPVQDGVLNVSSSNANRAAVPATVGFSKDQTHVLIPVTAGSLGDASISVSANGASTSATITVTDAPPVVTLIKPANAELEPHTVSLFDLSITPVQPHPVTVQLASSDPLVAMVPSWTSVPAGEYGVTFGVSARATGNAEISAGLNESSATAAVSVRSLPPAIVALSPVTAQARPGADLSLSARLASAYATPTELTLAADSDAILELPAVINLPAGNAQGDFVVRAGEPGTSRLQANLGQTTAYAMVQVTEAPLSLVEFTEPLSLQVGATARLELLLNAAQTGNTDIGLALADPAMAQVPESVVVPAGSQTAALSVTAGSQPGMTSILFNLGDQQVSMPVQILPDAPVLVSAMPQSLAIEQGAVARLTLELNAAGAEDRTVSLAVVDGAAAQTPVSVTIAAGERTVNVPVSALALGDAVIRATLADGSLDVPVQVVSGPARAAQLQPDQLSLAEGLTGRVTLALSHAPRESVIVSLSQSGAGRFMLPPSVMVPAGVMSVDVPLAASSSGAVTLVASANGGSATAQLQATPAEVVVVQLSPVEPVAYVEDTESFTAWAVRTDGSRTEVTNTVTWTSSDTDVVTMSSTGIATALAPGSATIKAEYGGIIASTLMRVRAQPQLALHPDTAMVDIGQTRTFTVESPLAAGEGGLEIVLAQSGEGVLELPASVLLDEGEDQASFDVRAISSGDVAISASAPQRQPAIANLTVTSPGQGLAIDSISPLRGPEGTRVTITGTGFDPDLAANQVRFVENVNALVLEASATHLVVVVPPGAQTGPINVASALESAASQVFTVERPFDIGLEASPAQLSLMPGGKAHVALHLASTGVEAFEGLAALSVTGLPEGVTAHFEPQQLVAGQPGAMVLSAGPDVAVTEAALGIRASITAAGLSITRTAPVALNLVEGEGTSLTGRFVTPAGEGIAGVVVRAELNGDTLSQTLSDAAGSFALAGLPGGELTLKMDATRAHPLYPIWPYRLTLEEGEVRTLPSWTISPPPAEEHFTAINNATQDQVVVDERFPGLAITLPAGAQILGWDGVPKTRIAVERLSPDALPTEPPPIPIREVFHLNFGTPMGGLATQPIPISIPNVTGKEPGEKTEIWYYDGSPMTNSGEWKLAGPATISADGTMVVSDPGYGLPSFCGVCGLFAARCDDLETGPPPSPPPSEDPPADDPPPEDPPEPPPEEPSEPEDCNKIGNPVELITGYEMPSYGGLRCGGRTAREMRFSYNPFDAFQGRSGVEGAVGHGWVLDYDIVLADSNLVPESKRLLLPPNERINFARQVDGTYAASGDPRFYGAVLRRWRSQDWELQLRNGTIWRFGMSDPIGRTASFLIEVIEPGGRVTRIDRRSDRKITRIGDDNRAYDLIYGANNLVSEIRDPAGRNLSFTYNSHRRIETITDADGGITRYEYVGDDEKPANPVCSQASDGLRIKRIHYPGMAHPTENHHGASRRVLRQTSTNGIETLFEYSVVGACVTHIDNPTERCTGSQCPRIDSWENYQAGWRIIGGQVMASTVIDGEGQRTTRRYDARRMVTDITRPDGQTIRRQRDAEGRVTRRTDALGRTTRFSYDDKGNITRTIDPLGRVTVTDYHGTWGKPIQITRMLEDGTQIIRQYQYDNVTGNLTRSINPLGHVTQYTYNAAAQLETIIDPLGHTTRLDYNDAGDLVKVTDALGNIRRLDTDAIGRRVATIDPLGFESSFAYNELDQLDKRTDPLGGETRLTYDEARRVTAVINARGHAIQSYTYDEHGRLTEVSDALGQTSQLEYDGRNLLTRQRDRANRVTDFSYDAQGRLRGITHPDGERWQVTRDAIGRVMSIEDGSSRIEYSYDAVDRLVRERTTSISGTHEIAYEWDNLNRLVKRTVNGVDVTSYFYDLAGRLSAVEYRDTLTTYTWDAAGRLTNKVLANGIAQNLAWDAANRLMRIEYRASDASLISAIDYQYDAKGQRTSKATNQPSVAETPMHAQYDAADRMTQITLYPGTDKEATYRLEYDNEGHLTRRVNIADNSDVTDYLWDSRGRLVNINSREVTASFRYDALDRRVERTINGQTLRAIYDGVQMIGELAGGVVEPTYLTGLQIDEMLVRHTVAGARTYLTDALGSVIAQTDEGQQPINWYGYSPYGEAAIIGDDEQNPVQYTGRENDGAGLYYYRARYYDPVLKRFISEDPIGLVGGINHYAYVDGNPVIFYDPYGLFSLPRGTVTINVGRGFASTFTITSDGCGNYSGYFGFGLGFGQGVSISRDYTVFDVPGQSIGLATAVSVSGAIPNVAGRPGGHTTLVVGGSGANLSLGGGFGYSAGAAVTGGVGFSF